MPWVRRSSNSFSRNRRLSCSMRFRGLDLNHLVTLETLLSERSLTRAAERHRLTQPAISNALTKFRDHFGDELLLRSGREMQRTPFANVLLPSLRSALAQLQSVAMARPGFDPATVQRVLRIITSDYVAQVFLPQVIRHFADVAPHVAIVHIPMTADAVTSFDNGEIDAMICPLGPNLHSSSSHQELFLERWICVARKGNRTVGETISVADYYAAPHVSPSYKHYIIDNSWRPPPGTVVRPATQLPFSAIPILVSETDFIAVLPERLVRRYETQLQLRRIAPLPPPPPVQFVVCWHPEHSMDAFLRWALDQLGEIGSRLN